MARRPSAAAAAPAGRVLLAPNAFSISFGLAGLAQCWATARDLVGATGWVADGLFLLATMVYLVTLAGYLHNAVATRRGLRDVTDPVLGPFASLVFIVPMLLGLALAHHDRAPGNVVFLVALACTAV